MPFQLVLGLLILGGLVLMGLTLSGFGSPDHSHEEPPRLPGHDIQDKRRGQD